MVLSRENITNSVVYANNYDIQLLGFSATDETTGNLNMKYYIEIIRNVRVNHNNAGYIYGVKHGVAKQLNTWSFSLDYGDLEADAALGVLTDADTAGGGTDIRWARIVLAYNMPENVHIGFADINGKKAVSSATFYPTTVVIGLT